MGGQRQRESAWGWRAGHHGSRHSAATVSCGPGQGAWRGGRSEDEESGPGAGCSYAVPVSDTGHTAKSQIFDSTHSVTGQVDTVTTQGDKSRLRSLTQPPHLQFLRKSTQGISYSLFALVMLGNTLYGMSVLLKNPEEGQSEGSYVLHHLPWLVGSLGVLLLDTIVSFGACRAGGAGRGGHGSPCLLGASPSTQSQPCLPCVPPGTGPRSEQELGGLAPGSFPLWEADRMH